MLDQSKVNPAASSLLTLACRNITGQSKECVLIFLTPMQICSLNHYEILQINHFIETFKTKGIEADLQKLIEK